LSFRIYAGEDKTIYSLKIAKENTEHQSLVNKISNEQKDVKLADETVTELNWSMEQVNEATSGSKFWDMLLPNLAFVLAILLWIIHWFIDVSWFA
jgi:hypothetical protein